VHYLQENQAVEAAAPPPPKRLLVIEMFAGSHPVGRRFQHLQTQQQQQQSAPYSLAAYAAIEIADGERYRAPAPEVMGLAPAHHLDLHASVENQNTRVLVDRKKDTGAPLYHTVIGCLPLASRPLRTARHVHA
jgi:hypothetical protein